MKDRFGFDSSKVPGTFFWKRPQISRRVFFRHAASAVTGYYLLPTRPMETIAKAAATPIGTAKKCIFILLAGAPSHVDTFDLKEGPWLPASFNPTSYGDVRFPQGLMPKLADQMGSLAFVRSARSWAAVHGLSQTWYQIGRNPISALAKIAPHIGSVVSIEKRSGDTDKTLPAFVSLNAGGSTAGAGYLPPENEPFYVNPNGGGLGNTTHRDGATRFDSRYSLLLDVDYDSRNGSPIGPAIDEMSAFSLSARKLMYNPQVDAIFNFDQNERNRYGNTTFGNACITARNLLRAENGAHFVQITFGSWDHHTNIYAPNAGLSVMGKQFDSGLATLLTDLRNDGTLDQTLIVALGEFGRTIGDVNSGGGRDHFLQQSILFAGAKVKGGQAIGSTDAKGSQTADPGWARGRDVRPEDVEATIYSALGIDWTTTRHDDPLGRGFDYVPFAAEQDLYGPINELWA
ncbi:MAG: DUF1501 domain-containing protein [Acidobacteriota bacterium]|nr:DUF1501 domain-containing protein [Acidobacteriota bacterium]